MNPCAHRELRDEDVAPFGEQDRGFSRDHFHIRISLHDLFDSGQWKLVDLVIMGIIFEAVDGLLPISCQNIAIVAIEALADLEARQLLRC